jgi:hypothetical protein
MVGGRLEVVSIVLHIDAQVELTVRGNIPSRTEDQKIGKRRSWVARRSSHDAEDGRINVID